MKSLNSNIWPITAIVALVLIAACFIVAYLRKQKKEDKNNDNDLAIITYNPNAGHATIFDKWQYRNDNVTNSLTGNNGSKLNIGTIANLFTGNDNQ